jgi:diadenosine tetraphosphate (Ap4A) HIT family hydrolase
MIITSPFLEPSEWVSSNVHAVCLLDGYPVSPGHSLIVPRRVVPSVFDLTPEELEACWVLLAARKSVLATAGANAFNIGVNDGAAAGQTIAHAHIHLIPRFHGDHVNPRGGVRAVIPQKTNYVRTR